MLPFAKVLKGHEFDSRFCSNVMFNSETVSPVGGTPALSRTGTPLARPIFLIPILEFLSRTLRINSLNSLHWFQKRISLNENVGAPQPDPRRMNFPHLRRQFSPHFSGASLGSWKPNTPPSRLPWALDLRLGKLGIGCAIQPQAFYLPIFNSFICRYLPIRSDVISMKIRRLFTRRERGQGTQGKQAPAGNCPCEKPRLIQVVFAAKQIRLLAVRRSWRLSPLAARRPNQAQHLQRLNPLPGHVDPLRIRSRIGRGQQ